MNELTDNQHCLRVALNFNPGSDIYYAALWHDALENGDATSSELIDQIGETAYAIVDTLTRRVNETYSAYIDRVAGAGWPATAIKRCDIRDNLARLDADHESLRPRYERALNVLGAA